jgi:6-phosphogluconolactonase
MNAPTAQVQVHDDADALARTVARLLLERLAGAQERGEVPQIGLTGGTIADRLHHALAGQSPGSGVDWSQVVVWWGDERFVPADDPERNAGQARRALLDAVPVDPAHVHEVGAADGHATAEDAAQAYSRALREHGAGAFEVLMLGIGPDAHVASLFPRHPALAVDDEVAVAVHDSPKPPPDRVTLTLPALNRSRAVWFLASGDGKADAVSAALGLADTDPTDAQVRECPASGVRGQQETVWHLDPGAAAHLPR